MSSLSHKLARLQRDIEHAKWRYTTADGLRAGVWAAAALVRHESCLTLTCRFNEAAAGGDPGLAATVIHNGALPLSGVLRRQYLKARCLSSWKKSPAGKPYRAGAG